MSTAERSDRVAARSEPAGPTRASFPGSRSVLAGLFAYHALVVIGAILAIRGILLASARSELVGYALIAAGIGIQLAIVRWSVRLGLRSPVDAVARDLSGRGASPGARGLCPSCGWSGRTRFAYCPRCGRTIARLPERE